MSKNAEKYIEQLSGQLADDAYKASDALARIGGEDVMNAMINLLQNPNPESRIMAARTLGKMKGNQKALEPLLDAIYQKDNKPIAGELMMALEGFDVSDHYVDIFRLYLFGSFKVSLLAKELLDYEEFEITSRTLKKAEKHWKHYQYNVKKDEHFLVREKEVEAMLDDLRAFLDV